MHADSQAALDRVLAGLKSISLNGDGWAASCPAHEDAKASLSIHERCGKILLHCHAGCSQDAVLAALGPELRKLVLNCNESKRQILATYNYVDERGKLLYQSVRHKPKGFSFRRPNGVGGWTWNLQRTRRVLYRLPEVLKAKTVLVVEGEKDALTSRRKMGLVGTCNPGGAGKWRNEYSDSLAGKHIAIIADSDQTGREHAHAVASSLSGKVDSLRVIELPGAHDLTDWYEHGGTRAALIDLIRKAPQWKPPSTTGTEPQGGFNLISLRDLMRQPEEQVLWLLPDKLPAGGVSVVSAKPKNGKSTFARCLALAVAKGEPFLDCPTTKGPVIYLALEEKSSEVRRHFRDLGATGMEKIHIHIASAPEQAVPELCVITKRLRPVLIIIDPIFKFVRVRDENRYAEVTNALEPLLTLARETGAHVLFCHHSGKMERAEAADSILGSTAIFGGVDSAIILKRSERYRTIQSSQRYGTDWPETVLNFDPTTRSLSMGVHRSEAEAARIGDAIFTYLSGCDEPKTRAQIERHIEGKTTHKRTALKDLVATGRVSELESGVRGHPFRYQVTPITTKTNNRGQKQPKKSTPMRKNKGTRIAKRGRKPHKN